MLNEDKPTGVTGQFTTNGKPHGYTKLTPFVVVTDPAAAIQFYEQVFEARVASVTSVGEEGSKVIIHAEIDFGDGFLQLGAATPNYGLVLPPGEGNACYSLGIYVPDVDAVVARAAAQGATVREPVATFVSGDRFGSILDPFGLRWSIMTRVEDLSQEESYRRVEEWSRTS